ncbi:MAG: iron-sulfur cluster assembly accessory protein [candidate division Zixibacteria bacterium]|nr:iron-sulfur cluster assembly accessory protein [candidate division Zixibacteria bacterium]
MANTTNQTTDLPIAGQTNTEEGVQLTDAAASELKRLIETQDLQDHFLRVGVQGGGCSGLMYSLHFDNELGKYDKMTEVKGIKVVVDMKSALYLSGTTIDFIQSLTGGGFKFSNPNASRSCGCGESFSA